MAEMRDPQRPPLVAPTVSPPLGELIHSLTRRFPASARALLFVLTVLPALVLADYWCLMATRVPVQLAISPSLVAVHTDGSSLAAAVSAAPDAVQFIPASPTLREYQIDGTDNTNNFTENAADVAALLPVPAYQFEAWMRDNAAYGRWVDVTISIAGVRGQARQIAAPAPAVPITLPHGQNLVIDASLERPEAPAAIEVVSNGQTVATLTFNRNTRSLELVGASGQPDTAYFPLGPGPFVAEVIDSFLRVAIWAWVVLGITLALTGMIGVMGRLARSRQVADLLPVMRGSGSRPRARRDEPDGRDVLTGALRRLPRTALTWATRHTTWADRAAVGVLVAAFGFMLFVALAQYQGAPHILDASAYFFQAKIFASGRLSAPVPADLPAFQGPFMVAWQGRWFAQYPPATSALLALGMIVGAPWLVEPLLGVAALGGIYLLGRRMFGGQTALLAVALGALSPFFIYLAASYLSHVVALCFEVYFLLFVLRFLDRYRERDMVAAGACLGVMFCARELSAVLCGVAVAAWVLGWHGRRLWRDRDQVVPAALAGITALGVGLALYLGYNFAQTGNALLLPRNLFSPADRYGFGIGVGFYGRHTLAAGMVVLDQLLTSLLIDLFGWPFYLTLAFIPLALVRRDGARRWDWFNLMLAGLLFFAQAGYFYHGIFLGPRYLYETLPFLLLLTARGITALPALVERVVVHLPLAVRALWVERVDHGNAAPALRRGAAWAGSGAVLLALVGFNLAFYLPQQIAQHWGFTGLPSSVTVDATTIYHKHLRDALVVTDNWMVYNYILWPLNDPQLKGDTLYAFAPGPADLNRLKQEYPGRTIYSLELGADGAVTYLPVGP